VILSNRNKALVLLETEILYVLLNSVENIHSLSEDLIACVKSK